MPDQTIKKWASKKVASSTMIIKMRIIGYLLLGSSLLAVQGTVDQSKLDEIVAKMEHDALELAGEVERLYQTRCDVDVLSSCTRGNYHQCLSKLPSQQCLIGQDLALKACGDGITCAALWDVFTSTVRVPESLVVDTKDALVNDPSVIEAVCFSQGLESYFAEKRQRDESFWKDRQVQPPQMYFGSASGAFRNYPGRTDDLCFKYDPRTRPWYIAASSGPKNVILILDTSGSMDGLRFDYLKEAAKRVIGTLTLADRVAIVGFNQVASVYAREGKYVYKATADNKELLLQAIDSMEAKGSTNYLDAFEKAFSILDNSIQQEETVTCAGGVPGNTAILFLTDGEATEPSNLTPAERADAVETKVKEGLANLGARIGRAPFLFTYSVSENDNVHEFPRRLACMTSKNGIWSQVTDDRQIFQSLTSYYQLFTLGLGDESNEGFTAWVEPYTFSTGGILGTTVAAPVYDRTKSPPLFLGVVGVDIPVQALYGMVSAEEQDGQEAALNRIVKASTAFCPKVDLELCELESLRRRGLAGDNALCSTNCTQDDFVEIEAKACAAADDYPNDLFADRSYAGLSYTDRACCLAGFDEPSSQCPANPDMVSSDDAQPDDDILEKVPPEVHDQSSGGSPGAIVASILGGLALIGVTALGILFYRSKTSPTTSQEQTQETVVDAGSESKQSVPPAATTTSMPEPQEQETPPPPVAARAQLGETVDVWNSVTWKDSHRDPESLARQAFAAGQ